MLTNKSAHTGPERNRSIDLKIRYKNISTKSTQTMIIWH